MECTSACSVAWIMIIAAAVKRPVYHPTSAALSHRSYGHPLKPLTFVGDKFMSHLPITGLDAYRLVGCLLLACLLACLGTTQPLSITLVLFSSSSGTSKKDVDTRVHVHASECLLACLLVRWGPGLLKASFSSMALSSTRTPATVCSTQTCCWRLWAKTHRMSASLLPMGMRR